MFQSGSEAGNMLLLLVHSSAFTNLASIPTSSSSLSPNETLVNWTHVGKEIGILGTSTIVGSDSTLNSGSTTWGEIGESGANFAASATFYWYAIRNNSYIGTPSVYFGALQPYKFVSPTITLANSIVSNSIDVVMGSPSDNALITATCATGDTCQIWKQGGTSYLANGITIVTLAYNALPGSATTGIYANDISHPITSNGLYNAIVRRLVSTNTITVTLTNNQANAIPASEPLFFTVNAENYSGSHSEWFSNSLNNTAIAFKNGTVTYSWISGNTANELTNANILYESAHIGFYAAAPPTNTFLPANTGIPTTNTLILIADNPSNNLLDGNFVGEGAWLTCPNGNGIGCGTYGKYDNGGKIFTFYSNFTNGNQWLSTNAQSGNAPSFDNGLVFNTLGSTGGLIGIASKSTHTPLVLKVGISYLTGSAGYMFIQESPSNVIVSGRIYDSGYAYTRGPTTNVVTFSAVSSGGIQTTVTSLNGQNIPTTEGGLYWANTGNEVVFDEQNSVVTTDSSQSFSNYYLELGEASLSSFPTTNILYAAAYPSPDVNDIMPTATFSPQNSVLLVTAPKVYLDCVTFASPVSNNGCNNVGAGNSIESFLPGNAQYVTEAHIFNLNPGLAPFSGANAVLSIDGGTSSTTINNIINGIQANNIQVGFAIGGYGINGLVMNAILDGGTTQASFDGMVANLISGDNAIPTNGGTISFLPTNFIQIDFEEFTNSPAPIIDYQDYPEFLNTLSSNIVASCKVAPCTIQIVAEPMWVGGTSGMNVNAIAPYVNSISVTFNYPLQTIQTLFTANVGATKVYDSFNLSGGSDNTLAELNELTANVPLAVNNGINIGFYYAPNANALVYSYIANAVINKK